MHIILFLINFDLKTYLCMVRPIIFAKTSVFFLPSNIYLLSNLVSHIMTNQYTYFMLTTVLIYSEYNVILNINTCKNYTTHIIHVQISLGSTNKFLKTSVFIHYAIINHLH